MRRTAALIGLCAPLAVTAAAMALGEVAPANTRYRGFTKQGHYVKFKTDASGDFIVNLKYKLVEKCTNSVPNTNTFSQTGGTTAATIQDDGSFKGHQKLNSNSSVKRGSVDISGKFTDAGHAQGKIKDSVTFRKSDPNKRGTCTGQSKFTVHSI